MQLYIYTHTRTINILLNNNIHIRIYYTYIIVQKCHVFHENSLLVNSFQLSNIIAQGFSNHQLAFERD